ncbi:MAG: hypothetical protein QOE61_6780 [Micromonosporaceae bacterium]|jgi:uncharacterized membrane protein|nr:hypothetical protein [Micromonosporaceae bacterium]
MTRTDWVVSIYAGAVWGGIFWLLLPLFTKLVGPHPLPPSTVLLTIAVSIVVGIAGMVLFRTTSRRVGAAISIGAFIGLPVLGWLALW